MKKCKAYHLLCEQEDGKQMEVKVEMSFYFGTIFFPPLQFIISLDLYNKTQHSSGGWLYF